MELKIALSGAAGCGKTTMMKALEDSEYVKSLSTPEEPIVFLPEIVRTLKKEFGFKINEHGTLETEMMVMTTHLQNLIARPRFVSDRCLVDNYIYSTLNEIPPPTWYSIWNGKLVEEMLGRYSVVFYIPNEFIPPEDGTRNLEPSYWIRSQMRFEAEYEKLTKLWPDLVVRISGPIPERIKKMEDAIRRSCK
jgi:GTPase SAR1 family protein